MFPSVLRCGWWPGLDHTAQMGWDGQAIEIDGRFEVVDYVETSNSESAFFQIEGRGVGGTKGVAAFIDGRYELQELWIIGHPSDRVHFVQGEIVVLLRSIDLQHMHEFVQRNVIAQKHPKNRKHM